MSTPKTRKYKVRVCVDCGDSRVVREDSQGIRCNSCARIKDHRDNPRSAERMIGNKFGRKNRKHGMVGTPTYHSWNNMAMRCKLDKNYTNINVCKEWLDFTGFFKDMGERPEGCELHRIDNDKGYEKGNCLWIDRIEHRKIHKKSKA